MRKAVAAVMVNAMLAATYCQYISQVVSMEGTVPRSVWIPAKAVVFTRMVRMVRQSVRAKASFWVQRSLTFQIRRKGIYRTLPKDQIVDRYIRGADSLIRSPIVSSANWLMAKPMVRSKPFPYEH